MNIPRSSAFFSALCLAAALSGCNKSTSAPTSSQNPQPAPSAQQPAPGQPAGQPQATQTPAPTATPANGQQQAAAPPPPPPTGHGEAARRHASACASGLRPRFR